MWVRRGVLGLVWVVACAGVGLRAYDLGTYGLWNDEAWVALCTRVEGVSQFWLSLSVTPVLWGIVLKAWALLGSSEGWLRGWPFLCSVLGLWVAYRIGRDLVGHPAGGLVTLAVLGADVHSIVHAKVLKQYSAEALVALAAFDAAARFAHDGRQRTLAWLAVVLAIGVGFANSQLLVGPPLLGGVLAATLWCRDWRRAGWVVAAGCAVAAWDLGWYAFLMAPRLLPSLGTFFAGDFAPADPQAAVRMVAAVLEQNLAFTFGSVALVRGLAALAAAVLLARAERALVVAAVALVVEVALLSSWRRFPIGEPRVLVFLMTVLSVHMAAAVGPAVAAAWRRPVLRPVAVALLAVTTAVFWRGHQWRALAPAHQIEDLGPLARRLEGERRAGEPVLLYNRSSYTYAYYQRRTPRLFPNPATTVGYIPILDDPDVTLVDAASLARAADAAFAKNTRVWFLGSRFRDVDVQLLRRAFDRPGWHVEEVERQNATLLRAWRG